MNWNEFISNRTPVRTKDKIDPAQSRKMERAIESMFTEEESNKLMEYHKDKVIIV